MRTAPRTGSGLEGWRGLAVGTALADAVVLFGYGVARGDREAVGFAVVMLVGVGLLRIGRGLLGLLLLVALFVNIQLWMFPAANGNALNRVGVVDLVIPGSLVAFSLAGLIAAVASLVHLRDPAAGRAAAAPTGVLAVVFVVASLGLVWAMAGSRAKAVPAGAVEVQTVNLAYVPRTLTVQAGKVTVAVHNRDLFWHTFTIAALKVDVRAPVGRLRAATFEAKPGTYTYYCRIPGHATLGMRGTLTVT
jgi:plastocyanin